MVVDIRTSWWKEFEVAVLPWGALGSGWFARRKGDSLKRGGNFTTLALVGRFSGSGVPKRVWNSRIPLAKLAVDGGSEASFGFGLDGLFITLIVFFLCMLLNSRSDRSRWLSGAEGKAGRD